jgi:uncharacterized peroxidase-related enzyme
MPFLSGIDHEDKVPHVLAKYRNGSQIPLLELHQAILRGDSPFSVQERELMAAYVSGVNECHYCYGAHSAVAKLYGVPESLMTTLLRDIHTSDVEDRMKPVFAYLRKLTLTPTQMTQADADAVFAAGWEEQALYDAVQICCLYNFMNRFVEGLGLTPIPEQFDLEGQMIKQAGYVSMARDFGIKR